MARKVVKETFKSLEAFIDIMEERPLNTAFKNENDVSSQRIEKQGGRVFYETETYNEAENILKKGYKEPLEKMKAAILKIGQSDKNERPRPYNDFVGYAPNVPNHLMNLPITMINRQKQIPKQNTIHLIYSFCAAAKTSSSDLIKGGINFISLVNSLEKQGYRVKIDAIFTSIETKTAASFTVTLKEYEQQTNLLKLAFPLVHPSMLRRFAFRWLETTPELKDGSYVFGYGIPLNYVMNNDLKKEREFLKTNGILKGENTYYCNVYEAIKAKSIEALAEKMQITK